VQLRIVGIIPHGKAGAVDGAPVDPAQPGQPARHVKLHRMPGIPRLPAAIDGDRRRSGRLSGIKRCAGRNLTRLCSHVSHPVPFAMVPIAMMPVMVVVEIVPGIMPVVAMPFPPAIVMEGKRHAGKMNARFRTPAIAFAIAGDVGRSRRGQCHPQAGGKRSGREKFSGQGHVSSVACSGPNNAPIRDFVPI